MPLNVSQIASILNIRNMTIDQLDLSKMYTSDGFKYSSQGFNKFRAGVFTLEDFVLRLCLASALYYLMWLVVTYVHDYSCCNPRNNAPSQNSRRDENRRSISRHKSRNRNRRR